METILALCIGLGLSAACGFRVFIPLLGASVAAYSGHLTLAPEFQWLGTEAALVALSAATILEIAAYYVPWLDHLLDTVSTPAAIVAGVMVSAAVFTDMSPFLRWTLATIAGGGLAGMIQASTVLARGVTSAATFGLGNPLVATIELAGASFGTAVSLALPVVAALLAVVVAIGAILFVRHRQRLSKAEPPRMPSVA